MREDAENNQAHADVPGDATASAPARRHRPSNGSARTRQHRLITAALRTGQTDAAETAIETWRGQADARDWIYAALASGTTPEHLRPVLNEIAYLAGGSTHEASRRKAQAEIARRCRDEYIARGQVIHVGPEPAFPDTYNAAAVERYPPEDRGPDSKTVRGVLGRKTCGWRNRPTSREFHEAVRKHTRDKTARERSITEAFFTEATDGEILRAWSEGAFTWRQAARTMRNDPGTSSRRARWVNQRANCGTWNGFRLWNY